MQLRVEVQFRTGEIDGALATLANFAKKAPAGSADHWDRMLAAAAQLETMGSRSSKPVTGVSKEVAAHAAAVALKKAEDGYRKCAAEDPKKALLLVDFLVRQKRIDEAFNQLDDCWKSAEIAQIAATCRLIMNQPAIAPSQLTQLDAVLSAALERADEAKKPRAAALLLVAGGLRDKLGKYADAEALYREVLQKDATNVTALNELAWLLALRGQKLDEAQELIGRAIELLGPLPSLLDTRANVELARGQPDKALADMQAVVELQPAANRYFHLARAHQKLGHAAEAADALKKAREMQLNARSLHALERPAYEELARAISDGA
jgi:tetratricopeptide (TPR) repeat protein